MLGSCRLRRLISFLALCSPLALLGFDCAANAEQAEEVSAEQAAALLLKTTVTIRVCARKPLDEPEDAASAATQKKEASQTGSPDENTEKSSVSRQQDGQEKPVCPAGSVSVCSGVSLGDGRIITFGHLPSLKEPLATNYRFRVTLPDGRQACAEAEVVDFYSGLILLRVRELDLPKLEMAEQLPKVGGAVLTAAAAGIDAPLVSKGVLSGVERTLRGTNLPPMLQCDISTTESSSGAAVIDQYGRLIGVLAATSTPGERFGWSYAIPYSHVRRVLDARVDDRLIVLVRQRPRMGLRMGPGEEQGTVLIERVSEDGPARAAGVQVGDQLRAVDGVQVRSTYQAVGRVMKHLPGDKLELELLRDGKRLEVSVELAGGSSVFANLPPRSQQQVVEATRDDKGRIELRNRRGSAELVYDKLPSPPGGRSFWNQNMQLKKQLDSSLGVILKLQRELEESHKREQQFEKRFQAMQDQLEQLRKKVERRAE